MNPFAMVHVAFGELSALAAPWIAAELLEPTPTRVQRAVTVAIILAVFTWIAYFTGSYYYVTGYGAVKQVIKKAHVTGLMRS